MTRHLLAAVPAALEALIVAVIGLGPCVLAAGLMWAVHDRLGPGFGQWWGTAVRFWLLGLGAPMPFAAQTVAAEGGDIQIPAYAVTLMPLGLTLLIAWRAWNGGRRFCGDPLVWPAWAGFAVASAGLAALAAAAVPAGGGEVGVVGAAFAGLVIPTLAFGVGTLWSGERDSWERAALLGGIARLTASIGDAGRRLAVAVARAAAIVLLTWSACAAALVAASVFGQWTSVVVQYEQLHPDWLGVLVITAVQFAYLPTTIVWAAQWSIGVGFAIGAGSTVTPFGTTLAPLPAWPVLAALPSGVHLLAVLVLIVPVGAFAAGAAWLRREASTIGAPAWERWWMRLLTGGVLALLVAAVAGIAAALASGAIGPGRLQEVGGSPLLTAAATLGFGVVVAGPFLLWPRREDPSAAPAHALNPEADSDAPANLPGAGGLS